MHGGRVDILDEVLISGIATLGTYATTSLRAELRERSTLDIAQMGDGNDHLIIGIEVLGVEFLGCVDNLATTNIPVAFLDLEEFFTD